MIIDFFVQGNPKTAGSKRGIPIYKGPRKRGQQTFTGHVAVIDSSGKEGKAWRSDIQNVAKQHYTDAPTEGPLSVVMKFFTLRPQGHFGTGKNAGVVKKSAPDYNTKKPDVLKLARAVEDALTGIIWRDDSQIVHECLYKEFGDRPGVRVTIEFI